MTGKKKSTMSILASFVLLSTLAGVNAQETIQVTVATVDQDGIPLAGRVYVNVHHVELFSNQESPFTYEQANGGSIGFLGGWGGASTGWVTVPEVYEDMTYMINALTQEVTSEPTPGVNGVNIAFAAATPTPPGTDVIVQPVDETTGDTLATLSFDNVTEGGMTTLTSMTPGESQGPPQGFRFGAPPVIIDLTTTATFEGNVEVCFDYSGMSFHNESSLRLFHSSDGSDWIDVTTSQDMDNDIICGIVTSFSFFGVFETADPVVLLEELAQQVTALNLQQGIEKSLHAKLDTALQILEDSNENNDVAATNSLGAFINAVEAQRGKKIFSADADDLVIAAQDIITALSGP